MYNKTWMCSELFTNGKGTGVLKGPTPIVVVRAGYFSTFFSTNNFTIPVSEKYFFSTYTWIIPFENHKIERQVYF